MRVHDSVSFPIRMPDEPTPLHQWRAAQQAAMLADRPPPVQLDITLLERSPLREGIEQARRDLVYDFKPLGVRRGAVSDIATPGYSRGSYTLVAGPGLQIQVELGPLMWNRVSRGALLNAVA